MPKIIRSAGVNVQRRPDPPPRRVPAKPAAPAAAAPGKPPDKPVDPGKAQASAEAVVEEMLSRARNDADHMLVNARAETMRVLQDALQEGRDQGLLEVRRQWEALQAAVEAELGAAVEALRAERRQMIRDIEADALSLVFDVAGKVLAVEMDRSDTWVEAMVKEALIQMEGEDTAVMRVSAQTRARVTAVAERMLAGSGRPLSALSVTADASLPPGGCVIETDRGSVHNGVEEKAERLKAMLADHA